MAIRDAPSLDGRKRGESVPPLPFSIPSIKPKESDELRPLSGDVVGGLPLKPRFLNVYNTLFRKPSGAKRPRSGPEEIAPD